MTAPLSTARSGGGCHPEGSACYGSALPDHTPNAGARHALAPRRVALRLAAALSLLGAGVCAAWRRDYRPGGLRPVQRFGAGLSVQGLRQMVLHHDYDGPSSRQRHLLYASRQPPLPCCFG